MRFSLSIAVLLFLTLPLWPERRLSAEEAVRLAIANSSALTKILESEEEAALSFKDTVRAYLPSLTISARALDDVRVGAQDSRVKRVGIKAGQVLFDPTLPGRGNLKKARAARDREKLYTNILYEAVESEAALRTLSSFVSILAARRSGAIRKNAIEAAKASRAVACEELKLGIITLNDFTDTEIAVKDLELEDTLAQAEERASLYRLKMDTGIDCKEELLIAGSLKEDYAGLVSNPLSPGTELRFLGAALASNTDLAQLRFKAEMMKAEPEPQPSFLPVIRLDGEVFFQGSEIPLSESGFSLSLTLGSPNPYLPVSGSASFGGNCIDRFSREVSLEADILPRGDTRTGEKRKAIEQQTLNSDIESIEAEISFSVHEALTAIDALQKSVSILKEKISLEETRLALVKLKVELGEARIIEVMDAEIKTAKAKEALIEEIVALFNAEAGLSSLCGMGFSFESLREFIAEEPCE